MVKYRLVAVGVAWLILGIAGWVIVRHVAALEPIYFHSIDTSLTLAIDRLKEEANHLGGNSSRYAKELGSDRELAEQTTALAVLLDQVPAKKTLPERLKTKIDTQVGMLKDHITAWRAPLSDVEHVVVVDSAGAVALSDMEDLPIGSHLNPADAPAAAPPILASQLLAEAMSGAIATRITYANKTVHDFAASPMAGGAKVGGTILVVSRITWLPHATDVRTAILWSNQDAAGDWDPTFSVDANTKDIFLLRAEPVKVSVFGFMSWPFGALGLNRPAGLWARSHSLESLPGSRVVAYKSTASTHELLAQIQGTVLVVLMLIGLAKAAIMALSGRGLRSGIERLADSLSLVQQGKRDEARINERQFPPALHRLVRLLNSVVDPGGAGAAIPALAKAPSLDDVLQAHKPIPALQKAPFVADVSDGYAPLDALTTKSAMSAASENDDEAPALPDVPEALQAFDRMAGEPTTPRNPRAATKPNLPPMPPEADISHAIDTDDVRKVYETFLEVRRSCGENVDEITFERFSAKLEQTRNAVTAKHNCTDVRFEVYVKNGKAALKATPAA